MGERHPERRPDSGKVNSYSDFWNLGSLSASGEAHNAKVFRWYIGKIGCGREPINHLGYPHDIIDISLLVKQVVSQKTAELYEKGYSTRAIARQLGIGKTTVNSHLAASNVKLRSHSNDQIHNKKKPKTRSIKTAPYGFCLVDGLLHKDPKEQSILKLILKWAKLGQSHCAIARKLNEQKLKPRHAAKWSQPTVSYIVKRHQEQ